MSRDGFLARSGSNSYGASHRRAKKQERELAKRGGGRITPGSGNQAIKGDVQKFNGMVRIEAKTTQRASFSITQKMLDKLEEAALPAGEIPAVVVEFIDVRGNRLREVAVVPVEYLGSINIKDQ